MATLPAAGERPRIIIVEDNPQVRRSLQILLQGQGWDVRAYGSAEAILDDARVNEAACLVADYRLSGINGIKLLERLREQGWSGRALLVTGYPSPEMERAARKAGYAQVMEKPIRELTLRESIRRLLLDHDGQD